MQESLPSPESEKITREQVVNAYKQFVDQGFTNPDDLDPTDPNVQAANELSEQWQAQEEIQAQDNQELKHRTNLEKTMIYVDAGFTDPNYLGTVLSEWLPDNAQDADKQPDNPERVETRRRIAEAMKKIRLLVQN